MRLGETAPQLSARYLPRARGLNSCKRAAISSLPVPLSPMMSTVASDGPTRASVRCNCFICGDSPMIGGARRVRRIARGGLSENRASTRSSAVPRQRLGQVVAGAAAHRLHARLDRAVAGHHDDIGAFGQALRAGARCLRRRAAAGRACTRRGRARGCRALRRASAAVRVENPRCSSKSCEQYECRRIVVDYEGIGHGQLRQVRGNDAFWPEYAGHAKAGCRASGCKKTPTPLRRCWSATAGRAVWP